jgi:hypothetical protein
VLLNERCSCGAERSQPSLVGVYHVHQAVAAPLSALDARLTGNTQRVPLDTGRLWWTQGDTHLNVNLQPVDILLGLASFNTKSTSDADDPFTETHNWLLLIEAPPCAALIDASAPNT